MILQVTFKTPDVLEEIEEHRLRDEEEEGFNKKNYVSDEDWKWINSFVKWGEYVTIEFDTIERTTKVIQR
jgi:hypothetical protein